MVQYFLRNDRIERLLVENVTALINTWRFLQGVSSPSAVKKVKQKPVPYTHQDVTFYRSRFAALTEKRRRRAAALNEGKRKRTVRLAFMTN